ncbi:MAG TPA: hypothetical protein VN238_09430, partial [Solirubrobacteraceae bacterium]|nr:hypothetical protein [Solirubrobacteraceae bacterium]
MRVTRAHVASLGAGLSLVAASVTLLFLLSAVVAVRGWPGMDPDDDVPAVELTAALPSSSSGGASSGAASGTAGA